MTRNQVLESFTVGDLDNAITLLSVALLLTNIDQQNELQKAAARTS